MRKTSCKSPAAHTMKVIITIGVMLNEMIEINRIEKNKVPLSVLLIGIVLARLNKMFFNCNTAICNC